MNNERDIFPLGVVRNSIPSHLKGEYAKFYNLNPSLLYSLHIIALRDLSLTKCLLSIIQEDQFIYEEIVLFQSHERAAFVNYCLLPRNAFELKDIDVLEFDKKPMSEEKFAEEIIKWLELNKI